MKSKRVDAPLVPLAIALAAMLSIGAAVVWHQWLFWLVTVLLLICLGLYLNASWRGQANYATVQICARLRPLLHVLGSSSALPALPAPFLDQCQDQAPARQKTDADT